MWDGEAVPTDLYMAHLSLCGVLERRGDLRKLLELREMLEAEGGGTG